MLATIEIGYTASVKILKEIPDEAYHEIRTEIPQFKLKEDRPKAWGLHDKYIIDLATDGILLAKHEIEFTVKRFKGAYHIARKDNDAGVNYTLQVAIPAIDLLTMNEVTHLDDACTDELQRHLDDGWRIIAVCPPDAQRAIPQISEAPARRHQGTARGP